MQPVDIEQLRNSPLVRALRDAGQIDAARTLVEERLARLNLQRISETFPEMGVRHVTLMGRTSEEDGKLSAELIDRITFASEDGIPRGVRIGKASIATLTGEASTVSHVIPSASILDTSIDLRTALRISTLQILACTIPDWEERPGTYTVSFGPHPDDAEARILARREGVPLEILTLHSQDPAAEFIGAAPAAVSEAGVWMEIDTVEKAYAAEEISGIGVAQSYLDRLGSGDPLEDAPRFFAHLTVSAEAGSGRVLRGDRVVMLNPEAGWDAKATLADRLEAVIEDVWEVEGEDLSPF